VFADVCSASEDGTDIWLGSCESHDCGTFTHMYRLGDFLTALMENGSPSNPESRLPSIDCEPKYWPSVELNTRFVHSAVPTVLLSTVEPGRYWIDATVGATGYGVVFVDDGSGSVPLLGPPPDRRGHASVEGFNSWKDQQARIDEEDNERLMAEHASYWQMFLELQDENMT
jgi:hypothetical protein